MQISKEQEFIMLRNQIYELKTEVIRMTDLVMKHIAKCGRKARKKKESFEFDIPAYESKVCEIFFKSLDGMTPREKLSIDTNKREYVLGRSMMYIAIRSFVVDIDTKKPISLSRTGKRYGRDHATVMNAINQIKNFANSIYDENYSKVYDCLKLIGLHTEYGFKEVKPKIEPKHQKFC